jgi:lipopolysaccharide/colanic/teichoic acid biosynthesis glycosyltransferase
MKLSLYKSIIKPIADFLSAFILLLILSPFILVTMLVLLIANKGSVFFIQQRPGLNAKPFNIIKFKTMRDAFDQHGHPLPDHIRLTKAGKFVRSASLDELLQLINVLKGDMSLIGPRPLLIKYLPRYTNEQARRHLVRPGISGWAQVNGRNAISWDQKFEYDLYYVEHQSFSLDFKIFFLTIFNILKRKGINATQHVPMTEFLGNNSTAP